MDAKARDLALLAALSLFCAMATWAGDRDILGLFCARSSRDLGRSPAAPALTGSLSKLGVIPGPRNYCAGTKPGFGGLPSGCCNRLTK
jgi:hypothetical protein